jgi:hypothetical protein
LTLNNKINGKRLTKGANCLGCILKIFNDFKVHIFKKVTPFLPGAFARPQIFNP